MTPVFLDTSGLIAVVNEDDQWHASAEAVWWDLVASRVPLITTSLVLAELGDGLSRVDQRPLALTLYDRLRSAPRTEIVSLTANLENRGLGTLSPKAG